MSFKIRNFRAKIAYKQKSNAIRDPARSPLKERLKAKGDSLKEPVLGTLYFNMHRDFRAKT